MTTKSIRLITAGMALASGILAVGDKMASMPLLPGWLTSAWPVLTIAATIFNHVAHVLIDPAPVVAKPAPPLAP